MSEIAEKRKGAPGAGGSHAGHDHSAAGNLGVAFFLNLAFTIIEIVGGLWTNSVAILSDAVHDAGDCVSIGASWYLQKVSKRKGDETNTYGYRRYSILGALITGTVLLIGLGFVIFRAVPRLWSPEEVNAPGMVAIAVLGIVLNGLAVLRVRKGDSLNEGVVSWHLLEDVLGWVAVLVGSAAMYFWKLPILDPILSIGISLFVLYNVSRNLRKALRVFLQSAPEGFDMGKFEREVCGLEGVSGSHHTHTWSLDGERHVLTTHLVMRPGATREQIVAAKLGVREILDRDEFVHVTVDVELEGEPCIGHEDEVPNDQGGEE
ncbi:MAG: cation diffusion facilitator family transporter [Fimbriimonas sp.]